MVEGGYQPQLSRLFAASNLMNIISAPPLTMFLTKVLTCQDKCPLWLLLQAPEGADLDFCSWTGPAAGGRVSPDLSCSTGHP